ncbi:MAG: bacillithiol system redox-active protein YtxJ [Acidobacteriota bacterium]|nr:bacillithiol system redox-active protein YtxJ [Acidobacteriota bacterium]
MFGWLTGKEKGAEAHAMPEIGAKTDMSELMARDLVVLFKHSHACPVSWAAHSQMSRFVAHHPEVPVYVIPVIRERAFAREVARQIDVEHESPQVIVLRHGVVDAVASHGEITEAALTLMLQQK